MSRSIELSRAELVRKRRHEHAQDRISGSSARAIRPSLPITVRGGPPPTLPASPRRKASTAPNRRFHTALSMPGVEVHMPAIRFSGPAVKWRLLSFSLASLLGAALYSAWTSPAFEAAVPQVSGNHYVSSDEIDAVLNIRGMPLFILLPADLEFRLRMNFPELASAKVNLVPPNRVIVEVSERKPVVEWQQGGEYTWIDANGVAFRPRGAAEGLITVSALAPPDSAGTAANQVSGTNPITPSLFIGPDVVSAITTLASRVPQGSSMVYDPHYGLGWADGRGRQVYFGSDASQMALKLEVYQSLVNTLAQKSIDPAFISVQYANAPYYRTSQ